MTRLLLPLLFAIVIGFGMVKVTQSSEASEPKLDIYIHKDVVLNKDQALACLFSVDGNTLHCVKIGKVLKDMGCRPTLKI